MSAFKKNIILNTTIIIKKTMNTTIIIKRTMNTTIIIKRTMNTTIIIKRNDEYHYNYKEER